MTPRQFAARLRGIRDKERVYLEGLRIAAYLITAPNLKKGVAVEKFWPLPWDKAAKLEVQPEHERKHFETAAALMAAKMKKARGDY
jgi:hypothetical protein